MVKPNLLRLRAVASCLINVVTTVSQHYQVRVVVLVNMSPETSAVHFVSFLHLFAAIVALIRR